jgi:apolipoprotein N-acyltransferase
MLFGGQRGTGPIYQSAFGFDGQWHYADKKRLVIFGEYVPFRNQLPFLRNFDLPSGDLSPAQRTSAIKLGRLSVGPMLCFEGLFADVAYAQANNDARVLAVMSIDDWYMGSNAPDQLTAASVFRAVETGLPLVRSAGLGYSQVVNQHGQIVNRAKLGERELLSANLLLPTSRQVFAGIFVFPIACVLSVMAVLLWPSRKKTQASP